MSCRSTACSSAATSFARTVSGLADTQVVSIFHQLKRTGEELNAPAPTVEEYRAGVHALALRARTELGFDDPALTRLTPRLDAAAKADPLDGPTWYAVQNVLAWTVTASAQLDRVYERVAGTDEASIAHVRSLVTSWREAPEDQFEDVHVPDSAFRYDLVDGIPSDAATLRALRKLGYEHYLVQPHPVFVYGTLRSGQGNHVLMDGAVDSLAPARLPGAAVYGAHRGFPYAVEHPAEDAVTVGEVIWLLPDSNGVRARMDLDTLEGFSSDYPSSSHYERVLREVHVTGPDGQERTVSAWTYMARGSSATQLREEDRIVHGDWVKASREYRRTAPRRWYDQFSA